MIDCRRIVRIEKVETAIVHRGQNFGGVLIEGFTVRTAHGDPESLLLAGAQAIAKGREFKLEFSVVSRDKDMGILGDQLVIAKQGQGDSEAASKL